MSITLNGTEGITLDNGSADGAQVTLASSGYSNWNLDNYSGRFRAYYNATEYFTINSSGNVGIGTSSPTNTLDVNGSIYVRQNVKLEANNSYIGFTYNNIAFNNSLDRITFNTTANTERMRIDSSGNVLIGTATQVSGEKFNVTASTTDNIIRAMNSNANPNGYGVKYTAASPNGTSNEFVYCADSTTLRASLRSNGGLANFSANNVNLSDERLKTDIEPAKSYLDTICSIPVVTFKYKDQTDEELNLGVIAQSVDDVAPELVDHSGFGDAPEGESPYLAIYQTDLQYALMKCIQEQQELIKSLTSRIETLEAK